MPALSQNHKQHIKHNNNTQTYPVLFAGLLSMIFFIMLSTFAHAKNDSNALFEAVNHGDTIKVKQLLSEGADVNTVWAYKDKTQRSTGTQTKSTPLLLAIEKNNIEMVRFLIANNADVNLHTKYVIKEEYSSAGVYHHLNLKPAFSAAIDKNRDLFLSPSERNKQVNLTIIRLLADEKAKTPYRSIDNDGKICGAVRRGNTDDLMAALKLRFDLSLEEGYLNIACGDTDLMGTVLESPHERYALVKNIRRYFTRMGKPAMFSELLMTKVNGYWVLDRIEYAIRDIEEILSLKSIRGSEMHTRYLWMQKKYIKYLKKHPVPGSAEQVNKYKKYLTTQ